MVSGKSSKENLGLEGHNASPQVGVVPNPDPALDYVNEHQHAHDHHHGLAAHEKEKHDDVYYSTGTTEKGRDLLDTPPQDYESHKLKETPVGEKSVDEESGHIVRDEEEVKHSRLAWRYYRKIRPFIPIVVWMVFTAYVLLRLLLHSS